MVGPEMDQPFDERAAGGQRRRQASADHHQIIVADSAPQEALGVIGDSVALLLTRRHCRILTLGAPGGALLGDVVGELADDLAPRRHCGDRTRTRLEPVELAEQPRLALGRSRVARAGAEPEAVQGDCG